MQAKADLLIIKVPRNIFQILWTPESITKLTQNESAIVWSQLSIYNRTIILRIFETVWCIYIYSFKFWHNRQKIESFFYLLFENIRGHESFCETIDNPVWTSGEVCLDSNPNWNTLTCVHTMVSQDLPLVWHLPTSWEYYIWAYLMHRHVYRHWWDWNSGSCLTLLNELFPLCNRPSLVIPLRSFLQCSSWEVTCMHF